MDTMLLSFMHDLTPIIGNKAVALFLYDDIYEIGALQYACKIHRFS